MSFRIVYSALKGVEAGQVAGLLQSAIGAQPGPPPRCSRWSDWQNATELIGRAAVHKGDVLVIADAAWPIARHIADATGFPHLELRMQEGDHWDFTLTRRGAVVADFSTRVGAFEQDPSVPRPWKQGSLAVFVDAWKCDPAVAGPYLIDWDQLQDPIWVRQGDRKAAGQCEQIWDFMRAIGIPDPLGHPDRIEFQSPQWATRYQRQPAWRRVIRRASVWIKGRYPDVPRPSREERELGRKRRSRVGYEVRSADELFR